MKKVLYKILAAVIVLVITCFAFIYYVPYNSQGISGTQIFTFSILDKDQ
ncbi:MAG: hypothetical protein ACKVIM_07460 [Flavobacteriales bacterium]|jgi:hypothetical protein